jgi:hypothetical protein
MISKMVTYRRLPQRVVSLACCLGICCALFIARVPEVRASDVGGVIDEDTTWSLTGSPYIITMPVLVMENVTLTIEPGVVIRFDSHKALQIDGELIARGTSGSPITFTSNNAIPMPGDWDYIVFTDTSTDAVYSLDGSYTSGSILQHVIVEYAGGSSVANNAAVRMTAASPFVDHGIIRNNASAAISAYLSTSMLRITNSTFEKNQNTYWDGSVSLLATGDAIIENNRFQENYSSGAGALDLYTLTHLAIRGNYFIGNSTTGDPLFNWCVVLEYGAATFSDNVITGNNLGGIYIKLNAGDVDILHNIINNNHGTGIAALGSVKNISHNIISENHTYADKPAGIELIYWLNSSPVVSHNSIVRNTAPKISALYSNIYYASINSNTIVNNLFTGSGDLRAVDFINTSADFNGNNILNTTGYAIYNESPQGLTLNAESNWWGTTSSAAIQALIYDWFDDSSKGIVDFIPYRSTWNPDAPVSPPIGLEVTPGLNSVGLSWLANPESDVLGYKVYYDTDAGFPYNGTGASQGPSPIDVGNAHSCTLTNLSPGVIYHFAVTAYDTAVDGDRDWTDGNESWLSDDEFGDIGQAPTANFSAAPISGIAPLLVSFTNTSTGDYASCSWNFGDGTTSSDCKSPSHVYQTPGRYTVTLALSGPIGNDQLTRIDYIAAKHGIFLPVAKY